MSSIFTITGPIYLAILAGFVATRSGFFAKADMRVYGKFVINVALPAMIFNALATRPVSEILNAGYLLAYFAGSLISAGLGFAWSRYQGLSRWDASSVRAMGMSCSNSGYVGYPILLLALPGVAGVALALCMVVENVAILPLLLTLAERDKATAGPWYQQVRQTVIRLLRTPLVVGLLAGLAVALFGVELPVPVARTVSMFAAASTALSLFVIGGALVGLPLRGMLNQSLPVVVGKLLVHPLAVWSALSLLPLLGLPAADPTLAKAAVLLAAMPMLGIYPILAQAHGLEGFASATLLLTTTASFVTINALLWLLPALS